jgi:hypothetical protein
MQGGPNRTFISVNHITAVSFVALRTSRKINGPLKERYPITGFGIATMIVGNPGNEPVFDPALNASVPVKRVKREIAS